MNAPSNPPEKPVQPYDRNHPCEAPGCVQWGSYGFDSGKTTRWFCWKHRELGDKPAARPVAPDTQGVR